MEGEQDDFLDKRVLTIAAEAAETTDNHVPVILMRLKDMLDSLPLGSKKLTRMKQAIWTYDLLQMLVVVLKQDFNHITGAWSTAAKLATLLSQCCSGLDPPETHEFYGVCLPTAVENLIVLARKVQAKYIKTSEIAESLKDELYTNYRTVLDAVSSLVASHVFLASKVMRSPWLLQLLITDDMQTGVAAMATVQSMCRVNSKVISELEETSLHSLLDELVYKLTATDDVNIASAAVRTVLLMCDVHKPSIEVVCSRYKGLRPLLSKWAGKGFGGDLRKLQMLLDAGNAQKAEMKKLHAAASQIQAYWIGYRTRQQLKRANTAMSKFHRSFRSHRESREEKKFLEKQQKELQHQLLLARKKAMRDSRLKQMEILQILPASEVDKYLANEQNVAVTKLQSNWRGYRERKRIEQRKDVAHRVKAAVSIQRAVRKWLERSEAKKKELPKWQRPPGLTDERRVELQQLIVERREQQPAKERPRNQQVELHDRVQEMLRHHTVMSKSRRKAEQHRHALIGQLDLDSNLLLNAPKLAEVTEKDVTMFVSRSVPVATKARQNHTEELRLLRQPWWRRLGDEYQDEQNTDFMLF